MVNFYLQKLFHREKLKDFNEQIKKLEELAKKGAQITNKGDGNVVFRTTSDSAPMPQGGHPNVPAAPLAVNKTGPNNYRLLMDPRTGRILGKCRQIFKDSIPTFSPFLPYFISI